MTPGVETIGREPYLEALAGRFANRARLVTLVGIGGVGKSTIARHYCETYRSAHQVHRSGGIVFVDCADVATVTALCAAICHALKQSRSPKQVGALLARRARTLLVLDNLEQVAAASAPILLEWLRDAPALQLLLTSRVALGLAAEFVLPVDPLQVPAPDFDVVAELHQPSPALQLLVQRGQQVSPTFMLTAQNIGLASEIVNELGGLPLAIELAAAKLRSLSLEQMLQRLAQPLDLLIRAQRCDRHSSIRHVIESSIASIDEHARIAFAALAVFPSSFSRAAAIAVIRESTEHANTALDVLCDHSFVVVHQVPSKPPMLHCSASVRQFARAYAQRPDNLVNFEHCTRSHAAYFARLADGAVVPGIDLHDLETQLDDLLVAVTNTVAPHAMVDLALVIDTIWSRRSAHRERIELLTRTIAATDIPARSLRAHDAALRLALGQAYRQVGDFALAHVRFNEAIALAQQVPNGMVHALALSRIAELVEISGDTTGSRALLQQAATLVNANSLLPSTRWSIAAESEIEFQTGHALRREGHLDQAQRACQKSLALAMSIQHDESIAALCYELGVIALFRNDYTTARAEFARALIVATAIASVQMQAATHSALGIAAQLEHQLPMALQHHIHAVQAFRDIGHTHREGSALYSLGCTYVELDDAPSALVVLRQARRLIDAVGAKRYHTLIELVLALAHHRLQDSQEALACLTAAKAAALHCSTEPALQTTVAIVALIVEGSTLSAAALQEQVQAWVSATPGDDPQFAQRMLVRYSSPLQPAIVSLEYNAITQGFRLGDGPWFALQTRAPLRRILQKLIEFRCDQPGEDVGFDALIDAGWPNEQIALGAAKNRLHVALSALRRMGLRDAICVGPHGYHLDPLLTVRDSA